MEGAGENLSSGTKRAAEAPVKGTGEKNALDGPAKKRSRREGGDGRATEAEASAQGAGGDGKRPPSSPAPSHRDMSDPVSGAQSTKAAMSTGQPGAQLKDYPVNTWCEVFGVADGVSRWRSAKVISVDHKLNRVRVHLSGWPDEYDEDVDLSLGDRKIAPIWTNLAMGAFTGKVPKVGDHVVSHFKPNDIRMIPKVSF